MLNAPWCLGSRHRGLRRADPPGPVEPRTRSCPPDGARGRWGQLGGRGETQIPPQRHAPGGRVPAYRQPPAWPGKPREVRRKTPGRWGRGYFSVPTPPTAGPWGSQPAPPTPHSLPHWSSWYTSDPGPHCPQVLFWPDLCPCSSLFLCPRGERVWALKGPPADGSHQRGWWGMLLKTQGQTGSPQRAGGAQWPGHRHSTSGETPGPLSFLELWGGGGGRF